MTIPIHLKRALEKCTLLVFDFDGVFTDNKVYINERGEEMVRCDRSDTYGLSELRKQGVDILILSTEKNPVVRIRAKKLGIECVNGVDDKQERLQAEMSIRKLQPEQVAYVGNDVNDLGCFAVAGLPIAVADAFHPVRAKAAYVTSAKGGNGAVREVLALLLQAKLTA